MKKFFMFAMVALLSIGCAKEYDDTGLRDLIAGLDARVSQLETSVSALQSTVGDGRFVRKVEEYKDPDTGRTTGITVTYTDGAVVHFNIVPTDPAQGPVFSVIRNGAGDLVWAVDGVAVKMNGQDVPVYQTPSFSIDEEGNLLVEVDGQTTNLGPVKSEGATLQDGIFTNLAVTDEAVVLTLSDGSTVNIPFAEAFRLNIAATEYAFSALEPIDIPYTVSAKTAATEVGVAGYSPKAFSVKVEADKIVVTPLRKDAAAVLMAYADSKVGLVSVVSLTVEGEGVEVTDAPYSAEYDYLAEGEDAVVVSNVVSNIAFDVKPVEEWIHLVSVRSQAYAITLKLDDNTTGEVREGIVEIVKAGTEDVVQTLRIAQKPLVPETGPVDLGKKGTANSYLVTAAGEYKFKAVKGNSDEAVSAVSAEVLWETENTETAPAAGAVIASVSVADGYVVFSTPETLRPGNALIGAKDASGTILWSWHIWIPATEVVTSTFGGLYTTAIMDRNLGALTATADAETAADPLSYGLYYQWGRKDPFVAPSTQVSGTMTFDAAKMSVEETIQHPTAYIKTGSDSVKDWNTESSTSLWGVAKTVYDPCPPGYIVPTRDKTTLWWGEKLGLNFLYDATNKWFRAGVEYDAAAPQTTGYLVFPVCGYIDQGALVKMGSRVYVWSAYSSSADLAYQLRGEGGSAYVEEQRKSRAGNVRCVVEPVSE